MIPNLDKVNEGKETIEAEATFKIATADSGANVNGNDGTGKSTINISLNGKDYAIGRQIAYNYTDN